MKTAAETMFEKLGYIKTETPNKLVWRQSFYRDAVTYFLKSQNVSVYYKQIKLNKLQAIAQQAWELGWMQINGL